MKKSIFSSFILVLFSATIFAQQGINYKAIITDKGSVLQNHNVSVRFTILENGTTSVYQENHTTTTDENGIIVLNIGEGTLISGAFNSIDWTNEQFLKTEIDTGSGYINFGTTAFKAVPLSKNSDKLEGRTVADIKSELDTEKFNSILSRLDNLEAQNAALTNQVNALQSKLDYISVTQDVDLDNMETLVANNAARISLVENKTADMSIVNLTYEGESYRTVRFSHVNVQIVNGTGATDRSSDGFLIGTGLGNLIIGYNEESQNTQVYPSKRTGYHNLIVGKTNNYTSYGGVIFGEFNRIESKFSTVTGGYDNTVNKPYSSISGGAQLYTPYGNDDNDNWFYWIGGPYHSN